MSDCHFGFLNIAKPLGWTSHDVVGRVRHILKTKRVGHAGTLDPLADGVLVVCVGSATRLSDYVMHTTKQYRAVVHLGITTDTYDSEGTPQRIFDASHITRQDVEAALIGFRGEIFQVPPMYSAIKQGGRKLYELARLGETVERAARRITITSLTITAWSAPQFTIDVVCSAGTYIRSLAYDLGETLGVGAHLAGLTRTASGNFMIENAVSLETLSSAEHPENYLIPESIALSFLPAVSLDAAAAMDISQGRVGPAAQNSEQGSLARAYTPEGRFLALLQARDGVWHPYKVFLI